MSHFPQKGCVLWFTGLSGSGKTTLSEALARELTRRGIIHFKLDGDVLREGLCRDLGFSKEDRDENIRRATEVSRLFAETGVICLSAFISPFRKAREEAQQIIGAERFIEVYMNADLSVCEGRDVKGLYKRARAGEIPHFTGVTSPYEPPEHPDITIHSGHDSIEDGVAKVIHCLTERGFISLAASNV